MLLLQMSDHLLYRLAALDPAPLPSGQRLGLDSVQDLHAFDLASSIAQVGDRDLWLRAGVLHQRTGLLKLLGQRVVIVGITRESAGTDEQAFAVAVTAMPTFTPNS